jgi:hypothetical protein
MSRARDRGGAAKFDPKEDKKVIKMKFGSSEVVAPHFGKYWWMVAKEKPPC